MVCFLLFSSVLLSSPTRYSVIIFDANRLFLFFYQNKQKTLILIFTEKKVLCVLVGYKHGKTIINL